jgi:capsular polysaccharide export protein
LEQAAAAGVPVCRVEDGFIRSLGLGSDLLPPASVIVDGSGIYFDPSGPSDLETLLATHPFDDALRLRARLLIDRLVAANISKYAAGGLAPTLDAPAGRRVVLVPGQVADDLSVQLGGGTIKGNLELLRQVRAAAPDAFIVYRPHPDVDAGHRRGAVPDDVILRFADRICRGGAMAPLIGAVDEVHTLTSLAGFEALLRGRRVVTYGQPFYAGWTLTEDRAPVPRRGRSLSVEELAAGTLLLYPRYVDPLTRLPCGPEVLIDRLADQALWQPTLLMRLRRLQGHVRRRLNADRAKSGRQSGLTIEGVADA